MYVLIVFPRYANNEELKNFGSKNTKGSKFKVYYIIIEYIQLCSSNMYNISQVATDVTYIYDSGLLFYKFCRTIAWSHDS